LNLVRDALGRESIGPAVKEKAPHLHRSISPNGAPINTFESDQTEQADLRGGRSPWFARTEQRNRTTITENLTCDALVVGGGITGSLIAERLTRQGLDVIIIERELPGRGTAASTSMLLWEINRSLVELTQIYGFERASRAYLYARTTVSGRIIIGGEDSDEIVEPEARDALIPEKSRILSKKLEALWPRANREVAYRWAGTFDTTRDGLPLIGPVPGRKGIFAAYGYGGNGITFSFLAAQLIGGLIAGETSPLIDDFALDRDGKAAA
jgi:glycine/D-amino acid oxidase-like deaminating enzyme